mgnify:FL=1
MEIKNNPKTDQSFLLVDSTSTLSKINKLKNNFQKIISFDLESDRLLTDNLINHEISENFFPSEELKSIDSACIDFCQWYNENNGNTLLSYEGINLGSLFRVEFNNFLITFLKNFIILIKIVRNFPDVNFLCSSTIYQILSKLAKNVQSLEEKSFEFQLTWDKIQYNVTNSISLKVSKENFQKLKKIAEMVTSIFIKNNHGKTSGKSFALIEFDSVKFETIFLESTKFKEKIFLYNHHRPIIYNRKSFKILKNSHVIPYITSKNSSKYSESDMALTKNKILKNSQTFFQNDEIFNSFFQFQGVSFWQSLKPFLIHFFNKKISDSISEIEHAKKFLLDKKPSVVILLSENGVTEQIMLKLAKKFSIQTVLLQHGIMLDNPSAENYNKILGGSLPVNSTKFFVWGNTSAKCALQSTCSNDKIETVGSPNIDRFFLQKKNVVKKSNTVLLLATGPRDQQSVGHNVNEWNKYENLIKKICSVVSKHNLDLIIKRHPDMAELDFSEDISQEFPSVKILKHEEILDLLLLSKIVISVGISSSIFEAQILEKPVISVIVDHDVYGSPKSISQSCFETKISDFEENFSKLVNDSQSYQQVVQNANNELKENFNNIGQSAKKILDNLKNFENKNS